VNTENCLLLLKKYGFEIKEKGFEKFIDPNVCYSKKFSCYSGCESVFINYLNYPDRREIEGFLQNDLSKEEVQSFLNNLKEEGKIVLKRLFI
jgi:hypothetical protein